ncbi:MAG: argininosuccinate lyase [Candidatus Fonsibacter ubiquis]|nr:argininosuccinate lyase [Candidatus Fonsibacter ubiquis]
MTKENKNKVWGTRVKKPTSKLLQSINSSIDIDKRLFNEDIDASIAHCEMLSKQKIIKNDSAKKIIYGLKKIKIEIQKNKFQFKKEHEDIHLNVEKRLFEIIGDHAGFLHTARSRNDQVVTDFKLWIKKSAHNIDKNLTLLIKSFLNKAKKNIDVIMPGFTHLKNAQPVLFSHYLLAYVEMFKRDKNRIKNFLENINENPLGSAALAGTSYNIDRHFTSKKLGFKKPTDNSIDSVSDRDFVIEFLFIASLCSVHLSRLAEEIIPDSAELIRGKTGRIFGQLSSMLTTMKGLPLAYFKDMQEDKESVFDAYDSLLLNIQLATELVNGMKPNKTKMLAAAKLGFTTATDFADYLVKKGMSFRDAHKKSATLVNIAEKNNLTLDELDFLTIKKVEKSVEKDVLKIFDLKNSVNSKKSYGGTSPFNVNKMINKYQKELK